MSGGSSTRTNTNEGIESLEAEGVCRDDRLRRAIKRAPPKRNPRLDADSRDSFILSVKG